MNINFDLNKLGPIQRKRWRITYHKIGHVIAHIYCEYPFDYVTIVPSGCRAGHVKSPDLDETNLTVQELEMCSLIFLAGEAIDRRLFGWHDWYECGGNSDFKELHRLHKRKYKSPPFISNTCRSTNYFFRLCRKVSVMLSQYEKEIHVLAHQLKKEKTLTYDQVLEILNRVDQAQVVFKGAISKRQRVSFILPFGYGYRGQMVDRFGIFRITRSHKAYGDEDSNYFSKMCHGFKF